MRRTIVLALLTILFHSARSQKPALDHSVYDGWESIGERAFSPDGKYLIYTVVPQEGDGRLVIRSTEGNYAKEIPRGAMASVTSDSRWVVLHIKPFFKDTRDARIKKKTPDQMPKDTLAWLELGKDSLVKIPRVQSYKIPEKEGSWLAYLQEKPLPGSRSDSAHTPDSLSRIRQLTARADSLARVADSLRGKIHEIEIKGFSVLPPTAAPVRARGGETIEEGTTLVLRDLNTGKERRFNLTSEYYFSKNGKTLVVETTRKNGDSLVKALVLWVRTAADKVDTVMKGFNDARNYALDEQGGQLAFVAERDSVAKALVKFYKLWYYTPQLDSAVIRADRTVITGHLTISTDYANNFSKDGNRLYLGLAPIRAPRDTNRVEFETARLDVWNYQDDYLSPQQLTRLNVELKRSYLATIAKGDGKLVVLGDETCENVLPGGEGNGPYALGSSTKGYRIQQQWEESGLERLYLIDVRNGSRKPVQDKVREGGMLSPAEKYILWYDWHQKSWFTYAVADGKVVNITKGIRYPLYDEEDDHPDDPPPHGIMGWHEGDQWVYIYDKYDIWKCDPTGSTAPVNMTKGLGRAEHKTIRYVRLDREERFIKNGQLALLTNFDTKNMKSGLQLYKIGSDYLSTAWVFPYSYNGFFKAKDGPRLGYLKGSFDKPYDMYVTPKTDTSRIDNLMVGDEGPTAFSHINPQQSKYNWFTVELHHWKMLDGKPTEGLLYKPENFDSTKKYPIIFYFYERDAETMYNYITPQPVRASINIPYFTSNGYLVFDPDIWYKTGQPGEDAYNSIMSAVRYLASRYKWVDTTKMALQGHSWGGYQTAYLVTRTNKFAAAEAGAPVANMTSAYGGIRWGTGISRQFQYEKSQSRLGATLWQRPDLYLKNSPLFRADKVTTPLLMMHNDADGAVPWYQGIEYFSALRRLGKKVWLIQYNGEDHGLTERRNRKDWSIRLAQFFGYYLKGEQPARWIREGVPATLKGIDWGLGTD
ncbi:MAG TPA: prolyl oligopeptidase family serine peptidase [Puia sp.]|nr:prolyl oligopeptidase family serine peptidase [Puia sp.]